MCTQKALRWATNHFIYNLESIWKSFCISSQRNVFDRLLKLLLGDSFNFLNFFPPKWKVSSIEKLLAMIRKIQFGLENIFCGRSYQESWIKNTYPGIFQGFWINTTTIPTIRSWIYYSLFTLHVNASHNVIIDFGVELLLVLITLRLYCGSGCMNFSPKSLPFAY